MSMTPPGQLHSIELRSQPGFAQVGEIECPENVIHERQSENAAQHGSGRFRLGALRPRWR